MSLVEFFFILRTKKYHISNKCCNFASEIRKDMRYYTAMTIAGSDSCGGAGIQADIKTMSALGVYAASAITAITVQNTLGVYAIQEVEPEIVKGQIKAVMDDIKPEAIKIGMVNDQATIHAIAKALKESNYRHLVIDPVMVATSGSRLMQEDALETFCQELLPMATLLTPNIPEAEMLSGLQLHNDQEMHKAAEQICQMGCKALLIKGGHFEGSEKVDRLFIDGKEVEIYTAKSVDTHNTHGTGCTLSSAITALLAKGYDYPKAIAGAKEYLSQALEAGQDVEIGGGHGPVNHFFAPCPLKGHEA